MKVGAAARLLNLLPLLVLVLLGACHPSPPQLAALPQPARLEAAPPRIDSALPTATTPGGMFFSHGSAAPGAPTSASAAQGVQQGDVSLNFADTDIREVVHVILGTTLKLNYTIDPRVHGTATLDTGKPLPRSALLLTLETLLNQDGATMLDRNGLIEIAPIGTADLTNTIGGGSTASGSGTQIIALRYAAAADLAKVLQPFVAEGAKISADPDRNALVITGDAPARQALADLVRSFDVDMLAGQSFAIFPVKEGDAQAQAAALESALRSEGGGAAAGGLIRVVPLPRVNAVLVASPQPRYVNAARRYFQLTTNVEEVSERTWHVYYVQNGQSDGLANLLQRAFTPGHVTAPLPGSTAPGAQPLRMSAGPSLFQTGVFNPAAPGGGGGTPIGPGPSSAGGGLGAATPPPPAKAPEEATPSAEPLSPETGGEAEDRIRIVADRPNNALLIYATPREYSVIEGMLHKIDIIPLQVLIDATIAEVSLDSALQYGTQFYFKVDHIAETLGATPSFPPSPLGSTGLVGFAVTRSPNFILQALADVTKVKVLSSPQVLVLDNEPAHLEVGQQVPILTGTATSTLTAGAPIVNSIDYHSTGVIMQVTPRINSGGLVTLDIAQEVSDVASPAANTATGSPTFDDRILQTRVAVQDGQTVALAGLIHDDVSDDNNGFPFLKDIPVLSTLLSSQTSTRDRTELLILITPHVVHDQRDAYLLTEDLRHQLINAARVEPELSRRPVPGLANPNGL
jgi:general secretion pathway protein D